MQKMWEGDMMNLFLYNHNSSDMTWQATLTDRGRPIGTWHDVLVSFSQEKHQPVQEPAVVHVDCGRRSMYRKTQDIDDIVMDDWEFAILFKSLMIEGEGS